MMRITPMLFIVLFGVLAVLGIVFIALGPGRLGPIRDTVGSAAPGGLSEKSFIGIGRVR